jgi:hypothetical protein
MPLRLNVQANPAHPIGARDTCRIIVKFFASQLGL